MIADAGHPSETNVMPIDDDMYEPFVATAKIKEDEVQLVIRRHPPKGLTFKKEMSGKLAFKAGRAISRR
ncbi:MAG: hypothetical protein AAGU11_23185 [Syntrophobacteraceae bacterium]